MLLLWPEIAARAELPAELRGDHRDRRAARASARSRRLLVAPRRRLAARSRAGCCSRLLLTGLAVEIALTPIALFHFHQAGLYGALANVVAIPLTTFVIMPLEALALLFDLVGLGAPFWWLTGQALSLPALARPRRRSGARRGRAAAGHAARRLRADVGGRPVDLPVADELAALGRASGRGRRALGARHAGARPDRHRRRPPSRLAQPDGRARLAARPRRRLCPRHAGRGERRRARIPRARDAARNAACSPISAPPTSTAAAGAGACSPPARRDLVAWPEMVRACAEADIVVADRRLPRGCEPRWLRADRAFLRRTGGLAITLGDRPQVATVAERVGRHPWADGRALRRVQTCMPVRSGSPSRSSDRRCRILGRARRRLPDCWSRMSDHRYRLSLGRQGRSSCCSARGTTAGGFAATGPGDAAPPIEPAPHDPGRRDRRPARLHARLAQWPG